MKKILLVCMAAMMVANVWAQTAESKDLIYTSDNKVVEAKVVEVSSKEIKYKDWNNPDGPVFVLTADEVQKVQFSNGTEKTFAAPVPAAPAQAAPAPAAPAAPVASSNQSAAPAKMQLGFQANVDLEGNLAFIDRYAFGGLDLTLGAGVRMAKFLYVGAAAGVLGEWGNPQKNNAKGEEVKMTSSSYIVPIFADARVYAPAASGCYPFAEVGIGGFVGLNSKLTGEGFDDITGKPQGGFYLMTGVGLEFKYVTIGAGYKLLRNENLGGSIQSRNHGYVRIGVSLGRPQKIR